MNVLLFLCLAFGAYQAETPATDAAAAPAAVQAPATETPATPSETPAVTPPETTAPPAATTPAATGDAPAAGAPAGTPALNPGTAPAAAGAVKGADEAFDPDLAAEKIPGVGGDNNVIKIGETEVKEIGSNWSALLTLAKVLALLFLPFIVARAVCSAMRLREFSFRMGVILFALTIGASPFINAISEGRSWKEALKYGIDLAGGTNMVFEVDHAAAKAAGVTPDSTTMEKTVKAVGERINPGGTEEITVRRVGSDRIEVIVPKATPERVDSIKRRIVDLGSLEFDILANIYDHDDIIQLAEPTRNNPSVTDIYRGDKLVAKWRPVAINKKTGQSKEMFEDPVHAPPRIVERNGKPVKEFLLVVDPDPEKRITGKLLNRAYEAPSDRGPVVGFTFNQRGGYLFQQLTSRYQPREGSHHSRLAILLNEEIHSAPTINSVIGASGVIEGDFDQVELDELIGVLNAGALDVPLQRQPVNEFTVSPLLGADVQTKGYNAMILAGLSVFVVMIAYYWKLGLVASLCMLANVVLLMGAMSLINATLTLPGLAGIVLTIGMSVDANVLIYERFREERDKGSSLRMTIHNGFHKALSTIVDSNLTTLITAIVLYVVGTEQIKGFAVSLFIGIVVSMFTALYMGRLLFDIAERKRWLTSIRMMQAIGHTNFVFSSKNKLFAIVSCTLIALGLLTFASRGRNNLDIDFRGGSMATFQFDSAPPSIDEMQKKLDAAFEESVSLEELKTNTTPPVTLIRIRTTKPNEEEVSTLLAKAFEGMPQQILRQSVQFGAIASVPDTPRTDFSGGRETVVTTKEPVTAATIHDGLVAELGRIVTPDGKPKYSDLMSLVSSSATAADKDGKGKEFTLRTKPVVAEADLTTALGTYKQFVESRPLFQELNTFDQAVAGETQWIAITAIVISLIATAAYLWFRFQAVDFGLAAIVAVMHDVFAVLGIVTIVSLVSGNPIAKSLGLLDFKLNLSMIAAYLTIVGYSLNDTIVVFDRIRELRGKSPTVTRQLVDKALNETLSRTLLTGVTTLLVIFIMYAIGGEGLRGFSFALFMGIVVGTYSSIFIASPVLVWLMNRKHKTVGGGKSAAAASLL